MGSIIQKQPGAVRQQGGFYAPQAQQPFVQQQPQFVQQQPQFVAQPPQLVQQQQPFLPPPSPPYRPPIPSFQQAAYRPLSPGGSLSPRLPGGNFSFPGGSNPSLYYENDAFLSNLTGWSPQDIERLRREFLIYANPLGVIDHEGFHKLYVASLLNMTWQELERESEAAFRSFDVNQTGGLDFNEYIGACSRLSRELYASPSPPPYGF